MRKALLLAVLASLSVTGVAYAASTVTHYLVLKGTSVTPAKGGSTKAPVPVGVHLIYGERAVPTTEQPARVKRYSFSFQDIRENTDAFPACGSSRMLDPSEGPNTCAKGSEVGGGFFIASLSSGKSSKQVGQCRADVRLFNGGNHTATIYVYANPKNGTAKVPECPLQSAFAINAALQQIGNNLWERFNVPQGLQQQSVGAVTFYSALYTADITVNVQSKIVSKKVKGKTVKHRMGLLESFGCPANHQRQLAVLFNTTNRKATRLVPCS